MTATLRATQLPLSLSIAKAVEICLSECCDGCPTLDLTSKEKPETLFSRLLLSFLAELSIKAGEYRPRLVRLLQQLQPEPHHQILVWVQRSWAVGRSSFLRCSDGGVTKGSTCLGSVLLGRASKWSYSIYHFCSALTLS